MSKDKTGVNRATAKSLIDYLVRHLQMGTFVSEVESFEQTTSSSDGNNGYTLYGRTDYGIRIEANAEITRKDLIDNEDPYPIEYVLLSIKSLDAVEAFQFFGAQRTKNKSFKFSPIVNSFEMK